LKLFFCATLCTQLHGIGAKDDSTERYERRSTAMVTLMPGVQGIFYARN